MFKKGIKISKYKQKQPIIDDWLFFTLNRIRGDALELLDAFLAELSINRIRGDAQFDTA